MTCRQSIVADVAALSQPLAGSVRPMGSQTEVESGPACPLTASTLPETGISALIISRCKRLTHANNEVRKRYLEKHLALMPTCSGVAE